MAAAANGDLLLHCCSQNGEEKIKIDRQSAGPVWAMSFNPSR